MRLQKYLADAGIASRRKCEEIIAEGRVTVNGSTAAVGSSVEENDIVMLDGKRVEPVSRKVVYAFYKPKNVICSSSLTEDRVKVTDYFKDIPVRLYTVGRLDYDSEGLIFVTNNGEFADKLTHPRYEKTKTYRVFCSGEVSDAEADALRNGVELDDGMTSPATVKIVKRSVTGSLLEITIHEGRNRQVRRMLEKVGHATLRLCRISIGSVRLGSMKPGERRLLSDGDINGFIR
ncbi:MAG: rRNA pseudouridine synthase [Clostridiales bacterium]|nr:rRNA pseudouridine synthase [Clostridiales bacterium]